ncbi:biopolymer transporter ExbB [Leptolyngbya sp. 'hensonii']|uniref:MotA/TolQ/ExbB proton channel family protein n=1 Tax=Leptolyngbya sp. 'hensonii' TaxID=1922337 RepID=UPI00094FC604|nr:MotA/TolQ/ExbB proton channel family protein [Leptolyngbya sp. 'hensonii']OLP16630.1 biopolymer transporter ExbB [Leptolyngbya sp. 'hensonii']
MISSSTLFHLVAKGGVVMIPIIALSIGTLACAMERGWFWYSLMSQEDRIVHDVVAAARTDLQEAAKIAERAQHLPIGRFLLAPLQLRWPTPETFRLALETTADEEFALMRRGNAFLESTIGLAPLLGLLGTVTGLILTFSNLNIGGSAEAAAKVDLSKAAAGISEALITTAGGMIVAIMALGVLRLFMNMQTRQVDYFTKVGGKLELIYRQFWYEPAFHEKPPAMISAEIGISRSESDQLSRI